MKKNLYRLLAISYFVIMIFGINGCSSKRTIEIQGEKVSPNGVYKAYTYLFTDGGSTVPFRRGISIVNSNEEKVKEVLEKNSPNIYLNNNSSNEAIDIEWEDDETLKVNFKNVKEDENYIYLKVDIFNGIKIKYE